MLSRFCPHLSWRLSTHAINDQLHVPNMRTLTLHHHLCFSFHRMFFIVLQTHVNTRLADFLEGVSEKWEVRCLASLTAFHVLCSSPETADCWVTRITHRIRCHQLLHLHTCMRPPISYGWILMMYYHPLLETATRHHYTSSLSSDRPSITIWEDAQTTLKHRR